MSALRAQLPAIKRHLNRRVSIHRTIWSLLAAIALALGPAHALAQSDGQYNSDAGEWDDSTDWIFSAGTNASPFYPVAGDWIIYDSEMDLVTGNEAFGNAANGSTWTSGGMDLNGNTLTHGAGSTWTMTGGDKNLRDANIGTGELINDGTFDHSTASRLLMRSAATFRNNGQFNFNTAGGDVRHEGGNNTSFINSGTVSSTNLAGRVEFQQNGTDRLTVENNIGATIQAAGSGGILRVNARLDEQGGTMEALAGATLEILGANNSSVAGTKWNTTGTGKIELGGRWGGTGSDLLGTVGGSGNVVIGETLTAAGNFSIDLDTTLASGGTNATPVSRTLGWENGELQLNGFTITLDTDVSFNATGNRSINGGNNLASTLINPAGQTFTHDSNQRIDIRSGSTFQNDGQFNFTTAGGDVRHEGGNNTSFVNNNTVSSTNTSGRVEFQQNGTDRLTVENNIGATIRAAGSGGILRVNAKLDEQGGTMEALAGATLEILGANNSSVAGTKWNTTGTGKIELGGRWGGTGSDLLGTVGGSGNVVIGETLTAAGNFSIDLDVSGASGGTNATPVAMTLGWENGELQLNGFTITLDTDVSFNATGNRSINGGNNLASTLINPAGQTFTHDSNQRIDIRSGSTFQNDGQFNFTTAGGDVRHEGGNNTSFINNSTVSSTNTSGRVEFQQNGTDRLTVENNIGATIQAAGSGGILRVGGRLDELGGTMEALTGATLEILGGNNSSVAGTMWNTTGTGKVELGGRWGGTGTDLLGTVGGSGNVVIGETVTAAGDFSINLDVSGASGGTNPTPVVATLGWEAGSINTNGNTITLDTNVSFNSTGNRAIGETGPASAAGTLLNPSTQTFTHDSSAQILLRSGVDFRNEGTFEFTTNGGDVRHDQGVQPTTFTNVAGALVTSSNTTGSVEFQQQSTDRLTVQNNIGATIQAAGVGGRLRVAAKLDELGGTMEALAGSTLEITGANNSSVSGTAWNTTGSGKVELGGFWGGTGSDLLGTVGGSGNVVIGETLSAAGDFSINLDVSGASGGTNATPVAMTLGWENGAIRTNGNTITLDTDVSFNATGNRTIGETGPSGAAGTLLNSSGQTFTHDSSAQILLRSGVDFRNEGTFEFTTNGGDVRHDQNNAQSTTFTNVAGGVVRATDTGGTVAFQSRHTNGLRVDNQGMIEVVANTSATTLNMDGSTRFLQYDTGTDTLTGGTYRVISGGPAAILDIDARDATGTVGTNDGIAVIGPNASVELTGAAATFVQLNGTASDLATVLGRFAVNDTQNYTTAGNLAIGSGGTMAGTGTLTVGANGLDILSGGHVAPGLLSPDDVTGTLTVSGTVDFSDGSIFDLDIENFISGIAGVDWDLLNVSGGDINLPSDLTLNIMQLLDENFPTPLLIMDVTDGGSINNFDPTNFSFVGGSQDVNYGVELIGNDLFLITLAVAVPEPATILIAVLGIAGLLYTARRRQRRGG